jgi:hypothetical protein
MQTWARTAGVLLLLSVVAGFFGEMYVPSKILVSGDAAATARNLAQSNALFRLGFAAYLIEAICDIALSLVFYVLLRAVSKEVALLSAFFGLVSTAVFAAAELFYFVAPLALKTSEPLALLSLRIYAVGSGAFMALYGIATLLRGILIYRSGYLPKLLGVFMSIAGAGFIIKNFTFVLAPRYSSDLLLAPMFVAVVALTAWLLVKGISAPIPHTR